MRYFLKINIIMFFILVPIFLISEIKVKIKDISTLRGIRENQLMGYGIVIGLEGTGDSKGKLKGESMKNLLQNLDINPADFVTKNVASVVVTANVPPFMNNGERIDISVSSIVDAKSLAGGILLQTPLKGGDGKTYAVGQGRVIVTEEAPVSGNIPKGAIVERRVISDYLVNNSIILQLSLEDFTTIYQIKEAIREEFGGISITEIDPSQLKIIIPGEYRGKEIEFISKLENLEVSPGSRSVVVIDRSTGTIVMGKNVKISSVAVSHKNITVDISSSGKRSAGTGTGGATAGGKSSGSGKTGRILYLEDKTDLKSLVDALNYVGLDTSDIIAILCNIDYSGALHGRLIIK
ncbi:MAG: flagellar basal body P-ring protein FlgI [Actinomycetia bacterium]|nr:flagellar basal body P-ring protein FlgI [Actinomycetes bacterium]